MKIKLFITLFFCSIWFTNAQKKRKISKANFEKSQKVLGRKNLKLKRDTLGLFRQINSRKQNTKSKEKKSFSTFNLKKQQEAIANLLKKKSKDYLILEPLKEQGLKSFTLVKSTKKNNKVVKNQTFIASKVKKPEITFSKPIKFSKTANTIRNKKILSKEKSQIISIPDVNFEQALIDLGLDTNGLNGNILASEANAIDSLNVEQKQISSLVGIEAMPNLFYLKAGNNNITIINTASNTNLKRLYLDGNDLSSIDVSQNTNLEIFSIFGGSTGITDIDLSNNSMLTNVTLTFLSNLETVTFGNSPDLTYIQLAFNKVSSLNLSGLPSLVELKIPNQTMTSLDVSNNPNLELIWASNNQLTELNTSSITALSRLQVDNNQIINLDVSQNLNLTSLIAYNNLLSNINVTNNLELLLLWLGGKPSELGGSQETNTISTLNVSNNTKLIEIIGAGLNLSSIDVSKNLDLTLLNVNSNNLTAIDVSLNDKLQVFAFGNNQISTIDILDKPDLIELYAWQTNLTSIDLTNNNLLERLIIFDTQLSDINIANNLLLKEFDINQVKKTGNLDLSQHKQLERFVIANTLLETINLNNGFNTLINGAEITDNPNLTCVQVDNLDYATSNFTNITNASVYSENCGFPTINFVSIPDTNFEQALIDLGYDSNGLNGNITRTDAEAVTDLNLRNADPNTPENEKISDLTGIESFINLTRLEAFNNNISSVDISNNTELTVVEFWRNNLASLDVSKNTKLESLDIDSNQISAIDVSNNPLLTNIFANNNQISSIDISQNLALKQLWLDLNQISSIDLSNNTNLEFFTASFNRFSAIDVSNNTNLTTFVIDGNFLTSIDVSQNTNLTFLNLGANQLTSVDITNNTKLTAFGLFFNQVLDVDLSKNLDLKVLAIFDNPLLSLDVSNNTNLEYIDLWNVSITSLDLSNNPILETVFLLGPNAEKVNLKNGNNILLQTIILIADNLECLEVDNVEDILVRFPDLNPDLVTTDCTTISSGVVTIPDQNFEQALIDLGIDTNTTLDGQVDKSSVEGVVSLDLTNKNIRDLKGIEAFRSLENLLAFDNPITSINLSRNLFLKTLNVGNSSIVEGEVLFFLDLYNNVLLEELIANNNAIYYLETYFNPFLKKIDVSNNQLFFVDIFFNTEVVDVNLSFNQLFYFDNNQNQKITKLNLSNNNLDLVYLRNGFNTLISEFDIRNNPNLTCVSVDDVAFANANFTQKDNALSYNLECNDVWTVLTQDDDFETAIQTADGVDTDGDGEVTYTEAISFTGDLLLSNKQIDSLKGLEAFTNADEINLSDNQITDINSFLNSKSFVVESQTGAQKLIKRPKIKIRALNISNNRVSSLNVSDTEGLQELNASGNDLESVNLKSAAAKGGKAKGILHPTLEKLDLTNNPKLKCVAVDNVDDAKAKKDWKIDPTAEYKVTCARTLEVEEVLANSIALFPNPTSTRFSVTLKEGFSLQKIELYNVFGKKVLTSISKEVDVSNLAVGVYLASIHTDKGVTKIKVAKK